MPATFSKLVTVSAGQTITASERNAEFDNILNNLDPSGMGDYSVNTTQMRAVSDPYPAAVESLATDLAGELERIRFVIKQISGKTQWYIDPDSTIATLAAAIIPSGTKMVFYQASPPVGWTAVAVNDKFLRVVTSGGTGGTNGGSVAASTSLAHTHTVNAHTHSTPGHVHNLDYSTGASVGITGLGYVVPSATAGSGSSELHVYNTGSGGPSNIYKEVTKADGSSTSGSTSPGTDSQLGVFAYSDVIIATKD